MSEPTSLVIRSLHVRKTAGIRDAFRLSALAEGVSVIHGPNGSGKSTTSSVLDAVIWPDVRGEERVSAAARYSFGGSEYLVDLDAGHLTVQRDGAPARLPELPTRDFRQRYRLSLHDLMRASGSADEFAEEVRRQSEGGHDFGAATEALGFRARHSAATNERKALADARARVAEATRRQQALSHDETELVTLEAQRDAAKPAAARAQLLRTAQRHANAVAALASAKARLDALPLQLHRMTGDEGTRLEALQVQRRTLDASIDATRAQRDAAEATAIAAMPDGPVPDGVLLTLHAELEALQREEMVLQQEARRVADREGQLDRARHAIGPSVTDAQLEAIDTVGFGELADVARALEAIEAERVAIEAELRRTQGVTPPTNLDALTDGMRLLARWLEDASSNAAGAGDARGRSTLVWLLAAVAMVVSAIVGLRVHPAGWAGIAIALGLAFAANRRTAEGTDARDARRTDYLKLRLKPPRTWDADAVVAQLDVLGKELAAGRLAQERWSSREDAEQRRAGTDARRAGMEDARLAAARRFGAAPGSDGRTLSFLADRLAGWQAARQERDGARAALETARAQHDATLARIGSRLSPFGHAAPATAPAASGLVKDLEQRDRAHAAARSTAATAQRRLAEQVLLHDALLAEIDTICRCADLEGPDLAALHALCAGHAEFRDAKEKAKHCEISVAAARQELESASGFEPALLAVTPATLDAEQAAAAASAEAYESLFQRASSLRATVDAAKRQGDVEQALVDRTAAEDALRAWRADDLRAMIGDALMRHVQQVTRDEHRPPVFEHARELFTAFTRGQYRLEFGDETPDAPACFRAFDTVARVGRELDELSSATRVQLLLAVRIAFIELQEHGIRLPLFLDETLGTSDDHRANAIIDAVITLAEGGRQVFYFTAQSDEVGKWKAALAARGVTCRCIDLAECRALGADQALAIPVAPYVPTAVAALPSPAGHDHATYSRSIQLPPVRAGLDPVSATHLWYLVDDLEALHLLMGKGIFTWGALEQFVSHGGESLLASHPGVFTRAQLLARAVGVMHEKAAIGRGRPVDREVLIDSGAVSDGKLDDVLALAQRHGGRGADLLDALERKEVAGFQVRKLERLREYLSTEGYLDDATRPTDEEIRGAMLGVVIEGDRDGLLGVDAVDTLLARIAERAARGAAGPADVAVGSTSSAVPAG